MTVKTESTSAFLPVGSVVWRVEPVRHGDYSCKDAHDRHSYHVGHLGVELAIEPVVEPRQGGPDNQDGDAHVVEAAEHVGHPLRVGRHGVEQSGAEQADHRTNKEAQEDQLLLRQNQSAL